MLRHIFTLAAGTKHGHLTNNRQMIMLLYQHWAEWSRTYYLDNDKHLRPAQLKLFARMNYSQSYEDGDAAEQ